MSNEKELNICDYCHKDFDELVTREGFVQTHFIEWVCGGCFEELEEEQFEDVKE